MSTPLATHLPGSRLTPQPRIETSALGRLGLALLFAACGLATFVLGSNYHRRFATNFNPLFEGALAAFFLALALGSRRSERLKSYWPVAYAFFVANMVWLVTTVLAKSPAGTFGNWPLRLFGLTDATPVSVAVAKVGEAVGAVAIILLLCRAAGFSLGSLYLRRGNLKWAVIAGLLVVLNFTTAALMATAGQPRSLDVVGELLLWGAVFSAANGFMEELWFRGLFLNRLSPHIGTGGAVIVMAVVFSLSHLGAFYLDPAAITVFLVNTFTHAIVLGYLIYKTDNLWSAALYHMAMDLWLFVGPTTLSAGG
jgi:membrane protease YdiL (CAAX protease family)